MQKKLQRIDFIIRDTYADGNIEHETYIEATELLIELSNELKILNKHIVVKVGQSESFICDHCDEGFTDMSKEVTIDYKCYEKLLSNANNLKNH